MAPASLDARQSHEAKSLCQCRLLRALAGSSDAASAARVGALNTRRPDCSAWVARAPRFTRGASGGELCAAYSHLRAVGWGLVDPGLGLSIRFHSMGENFHTGRFSRPLCDCTGTARRVRRPPIFPAKTTLPRRRRCSPKSSGFYSGDLPDSAIAASLNHDPTFKRCGASHGRSEREKQRESPLASCARDKREAASLRPPPPTSTPRPRQPSLAKPQHRSVTQKFYDVERRVRRILGRGAKQARRRGRRKDHLGQRLRRI